MSVVENAAAFLAAACSLGPRISAAADQIEQERRLPAEIVDALVGAGLFRMLVPASMGGGEADLITFAEVVEEIAKADASTAWCLGQAAGSAPVAAFMDQEAARTIFTDPRAVVAWGPGAGTAVAVEGGYRLSGKWSFASGCHHSTWLGGTAKVVTQDGTPCLRADSSPDMRRLLFPTSCAEFTDIWHVSGLRGTGSDQYAVEDLFVAEPFAVVAAPNGLPLQDVRYEPGRQYAFPLTLVHAIGFAAVALGIARSVQDAFIELAGAKTPRNWTIVLREDGVVQSQVARSEAGLRSARGFLHDTVRDAWAAAGPTGMIPIEQRILIRLSATHAIHTAVQVVDTIFHAAGATAIFASNPFERRFRDIHAVMQQIQGSQAHFKTVGQFFLGLEPDTSSM